MMTYMSKVDAPSIAPTQPERKSEGAHGASARAPMKGPSDAQREELGRLHPSPELVKFYRDRVNDFERERDELMQRVDAVGIRRAELHQSEWELKKRTDEVGDLQKALSDSHAYLFEERERLLKLQTENDELKVQEAEDRQRIQHLLGLLNPGAEGPIAFSRDPPPAPPEVETDPNEPEPKPWKRKGPVPRPIPKDVIPSSRKIPHPKTVYLPAEHSVDSLLLKIDQLQSQVADQKRFANERIAALLEDRRIRDADEAMMKEAAEKRAGDLADRLKRTELLLMKTTKDHIMQRVSPYILEEQTQLLEVELKKLAGAKEEMKTTIEQSTVEAKQVAKAEAEKYVDQFKDQLQRRSAIATQYEQRIHDLEEEVKKEKKNQRDLEHRRAMDIEGFTSDVTTLRRLLSAVDRRLHQTRLVQRLDDDERLDMLLEQLEQRSPDPAPLPGGKPNWDTSSGKGTKGKKVAADAHGVGYDIDHIRSALGSVEDRLTESRNAQAERAKAKTGTIRIIPDRKPSGEENQGAKEYIDKRAAVQAEARAAGIETGGKPRVSARPMTAMPDQPKPFYLR
jgi:coiled-coil domain-containing protein 77